MADGRLVAPYQFEPEARRQDRQSPPRDPGLQDQRNIADRVNNTTW
jgi:hypothetical protein